LNKIIEDFSMGKNREAVKSAKSKREVGSILPAGSSFEYNLN
jgi:hypothetical protein